MPRCAGVKRNGSQCTVTVNPPQTYCWWHDPAHAEERRQTASKGGRARASKVTKGLHELLEDLTRRVIDGELETSRGAVANQLIGTRIRLLEHERRVKELEELEERLDALEQAQEEQRGGGRRWGA
jgi:hypothetical protein